METKLYPNSECIKIVKPFHVDDRGVLAFLSDQDHRFKITEVMWMESKTGAVRANHYHKTDVHTIYLVSGKFEYITRDMRDPNAKVEKTIVNAGEIVTSPSMVAHKVVFLEDSLTVVLTTEPRDQEHYESDTVRLEVESDQVA